MFIRQKTSHAATCRYIAEQVPVGVISLCDLFVPLIEEKAELIRQLTKHITSLVLPHSSSAERAIYCSQRCCQGCQAQKGPGCAVAQHAEWRKSNPQPPRIAVNISQIQLAQKNFVMMIEEIVNKNGREACGLDIEITESLIMKDIEANTAKLKAIQELGVGIAIDDFGTGYSSFSYLATLPIDALKIDRSFIINIVNNPDHRTIVSTIISLAHLMKHRVIAEGIDTREQADLLHRLGCDVIQGYYFSRPVPANEFEAWQRGFSIKPGWAQDVA